MQIAHPAPKSKSKVIRENWTVLLQLTKIYLLNWTEEIRKFEMRFNLSLREKNTNKRFSDIIFFLVPS